MDSVVSYNNYTYIRHDKNISYKVEIDNEKLCGRTRKTLSD